MLEKLQKENEELRVRIEDLLYINETHRQLNGELRKEMQATLPVAFDTSSKWTSWLDKTYEECDHWDTFNNLCYPSLEALVLERYPEERCGPHNGDYHLTASDGVPILACGKTLKCSIETWGALMATIASHRDGTLYDYTDFMWL